MANPVVVPCPADTWTLIGSDIRGTRLHRMVSKATVYLWTYREVGDAAPTDPDEGKPIFDKDDNFELPKTKGLDIYVYVHKQDGSIRLDEYDETTDVFIQDQTTDPIIVYFNQVHNSTTLAVAIPSVSTNPRIIVVADATGIAPGSYIILFDPLSKRFTPFFTTAVNGVNITLDSPVDFEYPIGTFVDVAIVDMSVDGSVTPQVFGLRGTGVPPGVELSFDVTRIIFSCIASSAVDLSLFANIPALTNGILVRSRDTRYKNIFNAKDNREIAGIMFDFNASTATNPVQGEDGFISRLTFASPGKIGVVIRLPIGEDLEVIVQDNLVGITDFRMIAEGHIVD